MVTKKQMKSFLDDLTNPRILTLDEALALRKRRPNPKDDFANQDPDGRVVDAVLDRISTRFSGPDDIDALTYGECLVLEVTILMGEVLNGGFHQYLWNSSGDCAEGTRQFLKDIGATITSDLLERVSDFFPDGRIPEDRDERCALLEEFEEDHPDEDLFVEEDRVFYKEQENLYTLMVGYITAHREEFANPPDDVVRRFKRAAAIRKHFGMEDDPSLVEEAMQSLKVMEERFAAMEAELLKDERERIRSLVAEGRTKEAVRVYRSVFECSLAEAKAAVDSMKDS
ncbi:MAG: DUF4375 domain-containing protein [Thermodesulfobacteriota bacterium]